MNQERYLKAIDERCSRRTYITKDIEMEKVNSLQRCIKNLNEIMADLNNYHAKIADSAYVDQTLKYYAQNWNQPSIYYEFFKFYYYNPLTIVYHIYITY